MRWKGEFTLTQSYADLDVVPPDNAAEAPAREAYFESFGNLYIGGRTALLRFVTGVKQTDG